MRWAKAGVLRPSNDPFYTFTDLVGLRTLAEMAQHKVRTSSLLETIALAKGDQSIWSSKRFDVLGRHVHIYTGNKLEQVFTGQLAAKPVVVNAPCYVPIVKLAVREERTRKPSEFGVIVRTRGTCGGRPRFEGTRIEVEFVQELRSWNWSVSRILKEYPFLRREDVEAADKHPSLSSRRKRSA